MRSLLVLTLASLMTACGMPEHESDEFDEATEAIEEVANDPAEANGESAYALKNINITSLVSTAKRYLGVDYEFGAAPYPRSKKFDCSSYTQYIFGKYGISLPRTAYKQSKKGIGISKKNLKKGDLVFFKIPGRSTSIGHVGIYVGSGKMINASTGDGGKVQIDSITSGYWKRNYRKARRVAK